MCIRDRYVNVRGCNVRLPEKCVRAGAVDHQRGNIATAVELTLEKGRKIFVGYTGEVSESNDILEISETFARLNNIEEDTFVLAELDWSSPGLEEVELYCEESEYAMVQDYQQSIETSLLNQISVISKDCIFPFYVTQTEFVRLQARNMQSTHGIVNMNSRIGVFISCLLYTSPSPRDS
eukprot:TRINITY_DN9506_c0_g1_i2.p1 TRINITY_DN9506_c0_g1~~TRINITY_DN9506_c0_g1_i2.p1  ORF type:complete len:179 (+),score=27.21 TRINITY_DN9506_c0_g1_i2:64-600(+)